MFDKDIMKIGIYAGSFDPLTLGHLDIIIRSLKTVDKLIIGIGENIKKNYLFTTEERIEMINQTLTELNLKNFEVKFFNSLLVDFAKKENATAIIRSLRNSSDFDFEYQIAMVNQDIAPEIETLFLVSNKNNLFISSSLVKEILHFKGDFSKYVPNSVNKALKTKFNL